MEDFAILSAPCSTQAYPHDKYLDYNSHHPTTARLGRQHTFYQKRQTWREETCNEFKENGCPPKFIKKYDAQRKFSNNKHNTQETGIGFVGLPHVQGVPERITKVWRHGNINVGYKPIKTLNHRYSKPKGRPTRESKNNNQLTNKTRTENSSACQSTKWTLKTKRFRQITCRLAFDII